MSHRSVIGKDFVRRHRVGLSVVSAYLMILFSSVLIVPQPDTLGSNRFAFTFLVPLTCTALYLLGIFSFGFIGDLAARESLFPPRLFMLPVATADLVNWPMLYGSMSLAILWLLTATFAFRPAGVPVPLLWPAVFAPVFLAWAQALLWMPYGLRGVRVVLAGAWLITIDTVVLLATHFHVSDTLMIALLAPQLPLAYIAARYAVAKARRGDVPDWSTRRHSVARHSSRDRARIFDSPSAAQMWMEWREHGRSLPALVAMTLPFELALLFFAVDDPRMTFMIFVIVMFTPPLMAACTAATMQQGLKAFVATKPLADSDLIAAKLKIAGLSTVFTWTMVLFATITGVVVSGTSSAVLANWLSLQSFMGTDRAVVIVCVVFALLIITTWRQLVQTLYVSLSGRVWMSRANTAIALALLVLIIPVGDWILGSEDVIARIWSDLRWILALAVGVKMALSALALLALHRARAVSDQALLAGAFLWMASVLALNALFMWIIDVPHVPVYLMTLVAILLIPLARVSAAVVAVDGSRHQ